MSKRRKKRNRTLFVVEIIILVVLCVALFGGIWLAQKMSLINYKDLDRNKLQTASEVNGETVGGTVAESDGNVSNESSVSQQTATPEPTETPEVTETDETLTGIETIALIGLDTRDDGVNDGANSDTMILCVINHNEKSIKLVSVYRDTYLNTGEGYDMMLHKYVEKDCYSKANAAYNIGGPEQCLTMLNLNFDLNITEYVSVQFKALAETIELLGGLDIDMTRAEVVHMNNYNIETAAECGMDYAYIDIDAIPYSELDGDQTMTFHLNGSQAVSYARIRSTAGLDFRRASRQRLVLSLVKEKAMNTDPLTLNAILDAVLPYVTTNLDAIRILSVAWTVLNYTMESEDMAGFPFYHLEGDVEDLIGEDAVIPVTLEYNVSALHEFMYGEEDYVPSSTVKKYSSVIASRSGYTEDYISEAVARDDGADLSVSDEETQEETVESLTEQ